jgi:hypothetical protein
MFLARRSMPMRCASRVSVLHSSAWRSTSISSPLALRKLRRVQISHKRGLPCCARREGPRWREQGDELAIQCHSAAC